MKPKLPRFKVPRKHVEILLKCMSQLRISRVGLKPISTSFHVMPMLLGHTLRKKESEGKGIGHQGGPSLDGLRLFIAKRRVRMDFPF